MRRQPRWLRRPLPPVPMPCCGGTGVLVTGAALTCVSYPTTVPENGPCRVRAVPRAVSPSVGAVEFFTRVRVPEQGWGHVRLMGWCARERFHQVAGRSCRGSMRPDRPSGVPVRPSAAPSAPPRRCQQVESAALLGAAARAAAAPLPVRSARTRPCSSSGRRTVSWTPAPGRSRPSWTSPAHGPRPRRSPLPRPICPLPPRSSQPWPNRPQPALSVAAGKELSPAQCVLYAGLAGPCARRSGSRRRSCLCRRRRCR